MTFPIQAHKGDLYRIIHGPEEFAEFEALGWSLESEPGKRYIVHTAIPTRYIPNMEEVLAAGYSPEAAGRVIERETKLAAKPIPTPEPEPAKEPVDIQAASDLAGLRLMASAAPPLIAMPPKRPALKLRPPVAIASGNIAPRE